MSRLITLFGGLAFLTLCTGTTGCATMFSGSDKSILITSTPPGQHFEVINSAGAVVAHGEAPNTVVVRRGKGWFAAETYTFRSSYPGQATRDQVVHAGLNPWYFGNIPWFIGVIGPIGAFVIDPLTGAMWDFPATVKLDQGTVPSQAMK
jgi:hypothetical protein